MKSFFLITISLLIINLIKLQAHPGGVDSSGGHTCHTNCEQYGLSPEEYHDHSSSSTTKTADPTYQSPVEIEPTSIEVKTNQEPTITTNYSATINEDDIDETLNKTQIIELLNISVDDQEDVEIRSNDINIDSSELNKTSYGDNIITISYTDQAGSHVQKEATITIEKHINQKPEITTTVTDNFIMIDEDQIPENINELITLLGIEVTDPEDRVIELEPSNFKAKDNLLLIQVEDQDGQKESLEIEYKINSTIFGQIIVLIIIFAGIIALVTFLIKKLIKD